MEIKIIKDEKELLEIEINNLTIAEFLRNELWQDKATEMAVWKRSHPTKNPILVLRTKGKKARTVLLDVISKIRDKNSELLSEFKKAFK
jgi:DNA-directed RNA polymerase subunit L